jgi:hypothetical protein
MLKAECAPSRAWIVGISNRETIGHHQRWLYCPFFKLSVPGTNPGGLAICRKANSTRKDFVIIRAGYDIAFDCLQNVPMVLLLTVHPSRQRDILTPHIACDSHPRSSIATALIHSEMFGLG